MKTKFLLVVMLSLMLAFGPLGSALALEGYPEEHDTGETCTDPVASLFEAYYTPELEEGQVTGIVDEITETNITVDGVTYLINEETLMVDEVVDGDEVTVEYFTAENEDLVATKVMLAEEEVDICKEVTDYHNDGTGWGVLVMLYAIAAESLEACEEEEEDCGVTVAELMDTFKSGTGLGKLFKEYGKPSMLGVGHLRKAVKEEKQCASDDTTETASANGKGKGNGKSAESGTNSIGKSDDGGSGKGKSDNNGKGQSGGDGISKSDDNGNGNGKGKGSDKANEHANKNSADADTDEDTDEIDTLVEEGQVTGIVDEITATSITVDGITYLINEDTLMVDEVVAGDEVTVEYFTAENEDLVATKVELTEEEVDTDAEEDTCSDGEDVEVGVAAENNTKGKKKKKK